MAYLEEIIELRHSVVEVESEIKRAEADLTHSLDSHSDGIEEYDEMTSLVDDLKAKRERLSHQLDKARGA